MAAAIQQLNARLQHQETAVTILTHIRKRKFRTAGADLDCDVDQHARSARRRSDEVRVLVCADWSFMLRSYLGAVNQRYQQELTTTEASSTPRLNATLDSEGSTLSTQMHHILVMTTAGSALDERHNAGVNEGFEAWRQFVMEWEPKLRTWFVGWTFDERVGGLVQRRHSEQTGGV